MLLAADNLQEQHDASPLADDATVLPIARDLRQRSIVIVNADDWGWNAEATNRIFECIRRGAVSSVSAMVLMEGSEYAACVAREDDVDAGLHLNLTTPFTGRNIPTQLVEHQRKIVQFLRSHRYASVVFNPLLVNSFDYVVRRQFEEYERIYGVAPYRFDGHHHMHLCSNVVLQNLLPKGAIVRRNFSFAPEEKRWINRWFRSIEDRYLKRRHPTTDYFFDLLPFEAPRITGIFELARNHNVEIETHPARADEYRFLTGGGLTEFAPEVIVERGYLLRGPIRANDRQAQTEPRRPLEISTGSEPGRKSLPHICVCICTYKRAKLLKRLLTDIDRQDTGGLFTHSIVVADNDPEGSAKSTVEEIAATIGVRVKYCAEPTPGIALARNMVVANAEGDYLALIDDDEFPVSDWLKNLLIACRRYGVDGVLGPVLRHFEEEPPRWLEKSSLYDRGVNSTGTLVKWRDSRTGNVLIKHEVVLNDAQPFNPEFRAGEDQDFFMRKIDEGRRFAWTAEAPVHEVIPPSRWNRMYYIRKALLQGSNAALQPDCGPMKIAKSIVAVPLYALILPLAFLAGQSYFMTLLVKLCDHAGKLLALAGINPIKGVYVSD